MAYKSTSIKIAGTKHDTRIKLTEQQKEEIRSLYLNTKTSQRKLAEMFKVSKTTISFILNPDQKQESEIRLKKAKEKGKYKYPKVKWAGVMRKYRNRKHQLFLSGEISLITAAA